MVAESTEAYQLPTVIDRLHRFAFIVPNPMRGKSGRTQTGSEAGRCLSNVSHRRFLVCEFDFAETGKSSQPTLWTPLVRLWRSRGASPQSAMAAIIMRMMAHAPLTMVTFSGSKSLHGWLYCQGEREEPGSMLHRFMVDAARLGADPATFTRSQFVRMPGAIRPDTGRKQLVHYLDFKHVEGVNR